MQKVTWDFLNFILRFPDKHYRRGVLEQISKVVFFKLINLSSFFDSGFNIKMNHRTQRRKKVSNELNQTNHSSPPSK